MNNKPSRLPVNCPSCGRGLAVKNLSCTTCETLISGQFELPVLLQLSSEELQFILQFVKNSGSLKEMSKEMELSYPTIRNYLNELIEKLKNLEEV